MKNTNLIYFQNGLATVLGSENIKWGGGEKRKVSPNMHQGEDGLWHYGDTTNYIIYNNNDIVVTVIFYSYHNIETGAGNKFLNFYNSAIFTFVNIADAINCLRTGDYSKNTGPTVHERDKIQFSQYYPCMRYFYYSTEYVLNYTQPQYIYYSTEQYQFESLSGVIRYYIDYRALEKI